MILELTIIICMIAGLTWLLSTKKSATVRGKHGLVAVDMAVITYSDGDPYIYSLKPVDGEQGDNFIDFE